MGRAADVRRMEKLARLEPEEVVVACTRAWLSRPTRLKALTASRVRSVVAVTNGRLLVCSVSFWTRRPKRRALIERFEGLRVVDLQEVTGDRIEVVRDETAWILHFGDDQEATDTVKALRYGLMQARYPAPFPLDDEQGDASESEAGSESEAESESESGVEPPSGDPGDKGDA